MQTEKMSDTKTANVTKFGWETENSNQTGEVICPVSSFLRFTFFAVSVSGQALKWTVLSTKAQSEETVKALLSFLLQRLCSEPGLVFSLLLSLAPSSCNIKGQSHSD